MENLKPKSDIVIWVKQLPSGHSCFLLCNTDTSALQSKISFCQWEVWLIYFIVQADIDQHEYSWEVGKAENWLLLCVLDGLFHTLSACETCLLSVGDLLCSIGNFFFAGARIFFQSLDAAIFLYSRVSHIPIDSLVLPAICTNDRLTLGCELKVCHSYISSGCQGCPWIKLLWHN